MSLEHAFNNDTLISIKDNIEYNRLKNKKQLYARMNHNNYCDMELIDLVRDTATNKEYLLFRTEVEVNGILEHGIEYVDTTFDDIYDYDVYAVNKNKNDFRKINRIAIDYGYKGLEDFLEQHNKLKEEFPERMI